MGCRAWEGGCLSILKGCSGSETDGALTPTASRGRSGTQSGLTAFQLNLPYLTASDQPPQSFGTTSRLKTPQKTLQTPP